MKLLILDRDGVINEDSDEFIKNEREWIALPGSVEAIAALYRGGYQIYIATNQSGLGRGLFQQQDLEAMHQKLRRKVAEQGGDIAGIFYCPHKPEAGCNCRKPAPGLLLQIQEHWGSPVSGAPLVGDSLRDLEAGLAAGCRPILVKSGKGAKTWEKMQADNSQLLQQTEVFDDLAAVAQHLLGGKK